MAESLPTDREYLAQQVLKAHESQRPVSQNKPHGDHVNDYVNWKGKELADPSAGTGEGSPCENPKPELI